MEKKKLAVLLAVLLLAGAAASAGIYAYLSAEDSRVNRLTFGQNVIETEEEFPTPDPKPGDSIEKKVRVKNTGGCPLFCPDTDPVLKRGRRRHIHPGA